MNEWISDGIVKQIISILKMMRFNEFSSSEFERHCEISAPEDIKKALLEYIAGDDYDDSYLSLLNIPDFLYVKENSQIFEIFPSRPNESKKRVEFPVLIKGEKSDLFLILYCRKIKEGDFVMIYDLRVL